MSSFWTKTVGRIPSSYIATKYLVAFVWVALVEGFSEDMQSSDKTVILIISICAAIFYPIASFGWDYLMQGMSGNAVLFSGVAALLYLVVKMMKFFLIFYFSPLIALIVLICLYISAPKY